MPRGKMNIYGEYEPDFFGQDACRYHANYNMKASLPHPHYSDGYWNKAQTVWGAEEEDIHYDYSDRLYQFDYDKADKSSKEATKQLGNGFTPEWVQLYLTLYFGKPTEIRHIMAGCNLSNGYAYYVYGYRFPTQEQPKEQHAS